MNDRLAGILLGTAVGDALGLPAEGLSPRRRQRLMPGPWRHRLLVGRGHGERRYRTRPIRRPVALEASGRRRRLSSPAGVAPAVVVRRPAGRNRHGDGQGVREALVRFSAGTKRGIFCRQRPGHAQRLDRRLLPWPARDAAPVRAGLDATHPHGPQGGRWLPRPSPAWPRGPSSIIQRKTPDAGPIAAHLAELAPQDPGHGASGSSRWRLPWSDITSVPDFAISIGLAKGITGYIYHTVPVAAYAWLRHYGDFRATVEAVLDCGGDTDTVGAIAGALAGASVGVAGIPEPWFAGIIDWPRSLLTASHGRGSACRATPGWAAARRRLPFRPAILPRNLFLPAGCPLPRLSPSCSALLN